MSVEITIDELRAAFEQAVANGAKSAQADGFMTTSELAQSTGWNVNKANRFWKQANALGLLEHAKVPRRQVNGVIKGTDAYRIKWPEKAKGKKGKYRRSA